MPHLEYKHSNKCCQGTKSPQIKTDSRLGERIRGVSAIEGDSCLNNTASNNQIAVANLINPHSNVKQQMSFLYSIF